MPAVKEVDAHSEEDESSIWMITRFVVERAGGDKDLEDM
jgi:hypothetical protein